MGLILFAAIFVAMPMKYDEKAYVRAYSTGSAAGLGGAFARWLEAGLLFERGEYRRVVRVLRPSLSSDPCIREIAGRALVRLGRRERGEGLLDSVLSQYTSGSYPTDDLHLVCALRAAVARSEWSTASDAFSSLGHSLVALVEGGRYLLLKDELGGAAALFEQALSQARDLPPAAAGLAEVYLTAMGPHLPKGMEIVHKGTKSHPWYPGWYVLAARMALPGDWQTFSSTLEPLRRVAPHHPALLELEAGWNLVHARMERVEKLLDTLRKQCPGCPDSLLHLARMARLHHLYSLAGRLAARGLRLRPDDPRYLYMHGVMLVREGRFGEGAYYLGEAARIDPSFATAANMASLLGRLKTKYITVEGGPFVIHVPRGLDRFARSMVLPILMDAYGRYSRVYGTRPGPVHVVLFSSVPEFMTGVAGVPMEQTGMRGVCFGNVIFSMVPDRSLGNWEMFLVHELAHTFQFALTGGRLPRWLAEGLAEFETLAQGYYWQRRAMRDVAAMVDDDIVPSITNLDSAFLSARNTAWMVAAYKYSTLVVRYVYTRWGYRGLVGLLGAFAQGLDVAGALKKALGSTPEAFDQGARRYVRAVLARQMSQLLFDRMEMWDEDTPTAFERKGWWGRAAAAWAYMGRNREARRALARTGEDDPWRWVALHFADGHRDTVLLERAFSLRPDAALAHLIALRSRSRGESQKWLATAVSIDPTYRPAVVRALGIDGFPWTRRLLYRSLELGLGAPFVERVLALARRMGDRDLEDTARLLLVQTDPLHNPDSFPSVAVAVARAGDCRAALRLFGFITSLGLPDPAGRVGMWHGVCLVRTGHRREGCAMLGSLASRFPGSSGIRDALQGLCGHE